MLLLICLEGMGGVFAADSSLSGSNDFREGGVLWVENYDL